MEGLKRVNMEPLKAWNLAYANHAEHVSTCMLEYPCINVCPELQNEFYRKFEHRSFGFTELCWLLHNNKIIDKVWKV